MAVTMPPAPYKSPITDGKGLLTQAWAGWFRRLFQRIGEETAPSNNELTTNSGLTTRVTTLEGDVTSINSSISTINSTLTSLQNQIDWINLEPVP